jgi:hypothetical protein
MGRTGATATPGAWRASAASVGVKDSTLTAAVAGPPALGEP